jgi:hypothetical protein
MSVPSEVTVAVVEEPIAEVERPVSWRAVLAGVVVALVIQILLAVLGGAIGLAFIDPTESGNPDAGVMGIVAIIWWVLSGILAAWAGGVTAGRLCGRPATGTAAWHGLVAWAATTLILFYLLTTAVGSIVGGAFGLFGNVAGAAAGSVAAVAPAVTEAADPFGAVETNLNDVMGVSDPEAGRAALTSLVRAAFMADEGDADAAMDRAAETLARATRTTPEEARAQLETWREEYQATVAEAEAAALEAADTARKAASAAGIVSVIALVFGALAGWFGGLNSPRPDARDSFVGAGIGRRRETVVR